MRTLNRLLALLLLLGPGATLATGSAAAGATMADPPARLVEAPSPGDDVSDDDASHHDAAAAPLTPISPALWVVQDADTTIYLFGTIHMLPPNLSWFEGKVRHAFDAAQDVVVEVVARPGDEDIMVRSGIRPNGPPLSSLLPEPHWRRYVATLEARGLSAENLDNVKPWFAAMFISVVPASESGYSPEFGADPIIEAEARRTGKTLLGLETAQQQVGFFDGLPETDQLALLKQALNDSPTADVTLTKIIAAWGRGNPAQLGPLINQSLGGSNLIEKRILTDRNARWADWIKARLDQPGTVFIAVGAGHLAGRNSVQLMLRARGIETTLVPDEPND